MARIRPLVLAAAVAVASVLPAGCSAAHQAGPAPPGSRAPDAGIAFPLHTSGASIVDARGRRVKLSMVNWYGAESPEYVVGGLASQPVSAIISRIVSMGFNGVRLPWSNQMWQADPLVSGLPDGEPAVPRGARGHDLRAGSAGPGPGRPDDRAGQPQ